MKRWAIGFIVFLLTLGIGTAVAVFFVLGTEPEYIPETVVETVPVPAAQTEAKDAFVPEFRNLPDFSDESEESRGSLIDIHEFKSPDTAWPSYSRSEIDVRSGEKWLGLYSLGGKVQFAETRVTRSPRRGYIGPGDELYDWLKFERKGELLFLAKDIVGLKPGEVATLFIKRSSDDRVYMEQGFRRAFKLGEIEYVLRVTTGLQSDGGQVNVLVLESKGKSQIVTFNLYYKDHNTLYNSIGELLWVGDMDRDGRLDLHFSDYGYEKGGFGSNLYLSFPASGDRMVERVAGFHSAGC